MAVAEQNWTWEWDEARLEALDLIAEGRTPHEVIADRLQISRTTLWTWRTTPDFRARLQAILREAADSLAETRIAHKVLRVKDMQERMAALNHIVEERAAQYGGMHPGAGTGYVAPVVTAAGRQAWRVDTGLMAEMRALEQAVAKELGQLVERNQSVHEVNVAHTVDLTQLSDEDLIELERITRAASANHILPPGRGSG